LIGEPVDDLGIARVRAEFFVPDGQVIGQCGEVIDQISDGNGPLLAIAGECRQHLGNLSIERPALFRDQQGRRERGHLFGHRRQIEDRIGRHWYTFLQVGEAIAAHVHHLAGVSDEHGQARCFLAHRLGDDSVDLAQARVCGLRAKRQRTQDGSKPRAQEPSPLSMTAATMDAESVARQSRPLE
jgi:hypothetical protein